ncbi:hypothetical protein [Naasia sp.]|jgi:hypothetical protein|uniref:hypothetical protein n=1 Tax=Naasia sp. TaxID=2546198 RepID=UPI002613A83E|nr:hypothetical protein [Naasia sp.]
MDDRISDSLSEDSGTDVPSESGAGGLGTPSIDPAGVALTRQPSMDLPVDEDQDNTANPI